MFLTKMQINQQRRGARRLLASPQVMHAAVLAGFADAGPTEQGRVLWRLDPYSAHRAFLFIASPERPDLTHLVEQAGWPITQSWHTASYDRLLDSLRAGQHCRFRLTANPVRAGKRDGWTDTKLLGHVTGHQQQQWLLDRAERLGFRIPGCGLDPDQADVAVVDRGVRRFQRNGSRVTISMATFQGRLEVIDPASLRHALTFGIGRVKSYGCGLLTLAKLEQRHDSAVGSAQQ